MLSVLAVRIRLNATLRENFLDHSLSSAEVRLETRRLEPVRRRVEGYAGQYAGYVEDKFGGNADRRPAAAVVTGLSVF